MTEHLDLVTPHPAGTDGRGHRRRRLARAVAPMAIAVAAVGASACESPPLSYVEATITGGELSVRGTNGPDTIALRLQRDDPDVVEVDVHDDELADFAFDRGDFAAITVEGFDGDDVLVIDDVNGRFTDTEPTSLLGGDGDDRVVGGHADDRLVGGPGHDTIERPREPSRRR